jgi:hypothetical protein
VADIERLASAASAGLKRTIARLGKLALAVVACTGAIGVATFATGWWVFDGSSTWLFIGGLICVVPVATAAAAWFLVLRTVSMAPRLLDDVRAYLGSGSSASTVLIDHDSGVTLGTQARSFSAMRADLTARRRDLPALYLGVRSITLVPALAAISLLGVLGVGALGTVLLLAGLIS